MDLVREERPDVKVEKKGFDSLTNVELLSLLIGGSADTSMNIARSLYKKADCDLRKIRKMDVSAIMEVAGIGQKRANALFASYELARRLLMPTTDNTKYNTSEAIYSYLMPKIGILDHEEFWIMYLNNNLTLLKAEKVSVGGLTECAVDVRVVLRDALLCNSTVIAVAHNHPSGNKRPSNVDDKLTKTIQRACETMRIYFLDHLVVTEDGYYSYRDNGRI